MPLYMVTGRVTRTDDSGTRTIGQSAIAKAAPDAQTLKAEWETAMRQLFRDGPHDTVDFHCLVMPMDRIPPKHDPSIGSGSAWEGPAAAPFRSKEGRFALGAWGAVAWTNLLRLFTGRKPI